VATSRCTVKANFFSFFRFFGGKAAAATMVDRPPSPLFKASFQVCADSLTWLPAEGKRKDREITDDDDDVQALWDELDEVLKDIKRADRRYRIEPKPTFAATPQYQLGDVKRHVEAVFEITGKGISGRTARLSALNLLGSRNKSSFLKRVVAFYKDVYAFHVDAFSTTANDQIERIVKEHLQRWKLRQIYYDGGDAVFGGAENRAFADKYGTLEAYDKYIRDWE